MEQDGRELDGFVDALMAAPVGVMLLHRLAGSADRTPPELDVAVERIATMSFDDLLLYVVDAVDDAGPWRSDAPANVADAYAAASARRPVAFAIAERFGVELHRPIDRERQQWWTTGPPGEGMPTFRDYENVYDAGQFTEAGLWTDTDPPDELQVRLLDLWELYTGPISRWWMPLQSQARVFEIHRPEDWTDLVMAHPRATTKHFEHWELPSVNQLQWSPLLKIDGQRAQRSEIRDHLVPDWRSVADNYDGVHLSWAGLITAEGCITDLDNGDVTMLRYWFSERTLWLRDVFGEPEPAPPPALPEEHLDPQMMCTVDADQVASRQASDRRDLVALLGRAS